MARHKFSSKYDNLHVLQALADIARDACPADPHALTKPQFNAGAATSTEHPDLPQAEAIKRRFPTRSWRQIVAIALVTEKAQHKVVGGLMKTEEVELSEEEAVEALELVARRLGVRTLSRNAYELGRGEIERGSRARRPGAHVFLPNEHQIATAFGGRNDSWKKAIDASGLERPPSSTVQRGADPLDALDWALEVHGCLLTHGELAVFARAEGFQLAKIALPMAEYRARLRERRAARGLATPDAPPPPAGRPDYSQPSGRELPPALQTARPKKYDWTEADCVEAFVRFLDDPDRGAKVSRRVYLAWVAKHPGEPWPSSFERYGGFAAIREKAQRWRRRPELAVAARAQPPATRRRRKESSGPRKPLPWEEELLAAIRSFSEPVSRPHLVELLGWPENIVTKRLVLLHKHGLIRKATPGTKRARWVVV
jgi:hypothetical protein